MICSIIWYMYFSVFLKMLYVLSYDMIRNFFIEKYIYQKLHAYSHKILSYYISLNLYVCVMVNFFKI